MDTLDYLYNKEPKWKLPNAAIFMAAVIGMLLILCLTFLAHAETIPAQAYKPTIAYQVLSPREAAHSYSPFTTSINTKRESVQVFKLTAYCSCVKCCGKSDGITASGKPAKYGYIACNWLKFGTKVRIEGLGIFVVMDRGAKSQFGDKKNHIKHLDIWFAKHSEARKFGVRYAKVEILR